MFNINNVDEPVRRADKNKTRITANLSKEITIIASENESVFMCDRIAHCKKLNKEKTKFRAFKI